MRPAPRRFSPAAQRPAFAPDPGLSGDSALPLFSGSVTAGVLGSIRAIRRLVALLGLTLIAMPIQAVCLMLPGHPKIAFARFYWGNFTRFLGMRVRVIGTSASGRPVIFVSNHSSWLDIPVLGGKLEACFISKTEVGTWPLIGWVAKLGRTVFISRQRGATARERDDMRTRLATGDNLILFPEGTTSDGSRVMMFRSSFFAIAETGKSNGPAPLIQPVSVVYDRLAGLPTGRATRPLFAWYGDMDIATHYWRLGRYRGLRATVLLHSPLEPSAFSDRKTLSQAVWRVVAEGASQLRQNRTARPIAVTAEPGQAGTPVSDRAFA